MLFFNRNKEKEYANEFEELNKKLDDITGSYADINRELSIVKQQNKDLKEYINQLKELLNPPKVESNVPVEAKNSATMTIYDFFLEEHYNIADTHKKEYQDKSIKFDGFNYKIGIGRNSGQELTNIITLNQIYSNLKSVVTDSMDNLSKVANEFDILTPSFRKLLITLIKKPSIFKDDVDYYFKKDHTFRFKKGSLYIDGMYTGLKKSDVEEIKAYMGNSNNDIKTISKLVNYYSNVSNKYIVLSALNYTKLPSFHKDDYEVIEGRSKRKEAGLI